MSGTRWSTHTITTFGTAPVATGRWLPSASATRAPSRGRARASIGNDRSTPTTWCP